MSFNQNNKKGFIQIPILAIAVLVLTVVSTGGYYVTKQTEDRNNIQPTKLVETTATSTEEDVLINSTNFERRPVVHFMEQGAKGNDVCTLQEILKKEGVFDKPVTCYYGSATHWAVSRLVGKYGYFQTPNNFGTVDKTAMDLINRLYTVDKNGSLMQNIETDIKIAVQTPKNKTKPTVSNQNQPKKPSSDFRILEPVKKDNNKTNKFSFSDKIRPVTNQKNTERDYETEHQEFIDKAEILVGLLEEDKKNYLLLKETVEEHRGKHIAHARDLLNQWANVAIESSLSVPSRYKDILELRRDSIVADSDYLTGHINSLYETVDLYFIDALKKKDVVSVITEDQDRLRECIGLNTSEWVENKMYLTCGMRLAMTLGDNGSYTEDFTKITDRLVEVDNLVFETIGTHTKRAEEDILDDLERISRLSGIVQSTQASLNMITRQAEQSFTQPIPSTQSVKCYTTTNDSIFKKNRAYNTRCEPYTQTVQQKCALQKARSVSTTGVYIGGLVSPECQ